MARWLAGLVVLAGCRGILGIDEPSRAVDAGVDAAVACTSNADCPPSAMFCDLGPHVCVECLIDQDCAGATPRCASDRTCRGCVTNADCASGACLPAGDCSAGGDVVYLDPMGTDLPPCTQADPCQSLAFALTLVSASRPYIKIHGTLTTGATLQSKYVTILSDPGASLAAPDDPMLDVRSSFVTIYGLDLACPPSPVVTAIQTQMASSLTLIGVRAHGCGRYALDARGGSLTVERSLIDDNPGGGVSTDSSAAYSITNSFIVRNGASTGGVGGLSLNASFTGQNRFEFNTVVDNSVKAGTTAAGIRCEATGLAALKNLIARNYVGGDAAASNANTSGSCDFQKSLISPTVTGLGFVQPDAYPVDYHLTSASSAIDTAGASSTIATDYDQQARPQGLAYDYGADEYKP